MADPYYPVSLLGPSFKQPPAMAFVSPYAAELMHSRSDTMRERLMGLLGMGSTREGVRSAEKAGRASAEDLTREQVIRQFIRDKGLLVIPVAATGAGLVDSDEAYAQDVDPTLWDYTRGPLPEELGPAAPGPSPDQTPPPGLLVMPRPVAPPPDYTRGLMPNR